MENYNIIGEIYYEKKFFYVRDTGDVYKVADGLPLPNSPIVSYTKHNKPEYFKKIVAVGELEKLVEKVIDDPKDITVFPDTTFEGVGLA